MYLHTAAHTRASPIQLQLVFSLFYNRYFLQSPTIFMFFFQMDWVKPPDTSSNSIFQGRALGVFNASIDPVQLER